jgi:hypothetical protein
VVLVLGGAGAGWLWYWVMRIGWCWYWVVVVLGGACTGWWWYWVVLVLGGAVIGGAGIVTGDPTAMLFIIWYQPYANGKGKGHPRTGHEGPDRGVEV